MHRWKDSQVIKQCCSKSVIFNILARVATHQHKATMRCVIATRIILKYTQKRKASENHLLNK